MESVTLVYVVLPRVSHTTHVFLIIMSNRLNLKQMSNEEKIKIVALAEVGLSSREIAKRVRCHQSTVVRIIRKSRSQGSTERKKGTGRNRKTNPRLDRMMMRLSLENRFKTANEIS